MGACDAVPVRNRLRTELCEQGRAARGLRRRRDGAAWSPYEGETWNELSNFLDFWAVSFANQNAGWMVGVGGRIVKIRF